jgi:hypothetical protein
LESQSTPNVPPPLPAEDSPNPTEVLPKPVPEVDELPDDPSPDSKNTRRKRKLRKRSDEWVLSNLLDRLHDKIVNLQESLSTLVVVAAATDHESAVDPADESWILGCNSHGHPLQILKLQLLRSLIIIDTFCETFAEDDEDTAWIPSLSPDLKHDWNDECVRVGLRGRKTMVNRLLAHLNEEISIRWACTDRTSFQNISTVHYRVGETRNAEAEGLFLLSSKHHLAEATASSYSWLGKIVERSIWAQITMAMHWARNDTNDMACNLVFEYLISSTPSFKIEDYPLMPPTLSLTALESLLMLHEDSVVMMISSSANNFNGEKEHTQWFLEYLYSCNDQALVKKVLQAISLTVHVTAGIWKERRKSSDEKIHDVACIELASYQRLSKAFLQKEVEQIQFVSFDVSKVQNWSGPLVEKLIQPVSGKDSRLTSLRRNALIIALLLQGISDIADETLYSILTDMDPHLAQKKVQNSLDLISASWYAAKQEVIRQVDLYRRQIGATSTIPIHVVDFFCFGTMICNNTTTWDLESRSRILCQALECASCVADGETTLRLASCIIENHEKVELSGSLSSPFISDLFETIRQTNAMPTVRVINLERRKDRMNAFVAQACRERLLVIKAVVRFTEDVVQHTKPAQVFTEGYECGLFAFDGIGRLVEANQRLARQLGSGDLLDRLVETSWRPNDLKAFDRDAPNDEVLVRMTPSEKACALSHVSSWKGVMRSLQLPEEEEDIQTSSFEPDKRPLRYASYLKRLYRISGFAEGPALLPRNDNMAPAPVCVILEDDAILVDRFTEKLAALLKELPRDFHFCSLGYSRPKSAPIVPFTSKLGIPSMLWYLTGYILSEAGARYLLDSLPVVGPVDSWVGLQMTSNWDNVFGMKLGVGVHSKPNSELPAHRDLCKILKFRAFGALQPLCTQKVRVEAAATAGTVVAASTGRHWRQRDTDIEYSGYVSKTSAVSNTNR